MINTPIICFIGDVDWASDYCVEDFINLFSGYGIRPTLFATHDSHFLKDQEVARKIDVGIHPNFLPGSSQGDDYLSIIEDLMVMYPDAKTFRSHCF